MPCTQINPVSFTFSSMAFCKMVIYCISHMIDTLTILVQICAITVSAQQCNSINTCHHANTEGVSPIFQEFQRPEHHSCISYCTQDPHCKAVTRDPTLDICRLHFEADNIACLQVVPAPGKSIWVINEYTHHHSRCYMVTYIQVFCI